MEKLIINRFADEVVDTEFNLKQGTNDIPKMKKDVEDLDKALDEVIDKDVDKALDVSSSNEVLKSSIGGWATLGRIVASVSDLVNKTQGNMTNYLTSFNSTLSAIVNKVPKLTLPSKSKETDSTPVQSGDTGPIKEATQALKEEAKATKEVGETSKNTKQDVKSFGEKLAELEDNASKVSSVFKDKFKQVGNTVKSLLQFGLITKGAASLSSYVTTATSELSDFIESANLFEVSLAGYAKEAEAWAARISEALGVDLSELYTYAGRFFGMAQSIGVASDAAYIMSKNLTQLALDLKSLYNLESNQSAANMLISALSGETESIKRLGVAVGTNALQEELANLGFDEQVTNLNQASKAMLTYIQIMKSTSTAQTDLAHTAMSPANAFNAFKTQCTELARAIGNLLLPIAMKILPIMYALTQVIEDAALKLANLFGLKIDFEVDRVAELDKYIKKTGDDAKKSAGKINNMLAPFDELNVVENKTSGSGSSGAVDLTAELAKLMPQYDMLDGFTDSIKKKAEQLIPVMRTLAVVLGVVAVAIAGIKLVGFISLLGSGTAAAGKFGAGIAALSKGFTKIIPLLNKFAVPLAAIIAGIETFTEVTKTSNKLQEGYVKAIKNSDAALKEEMDSMSKTTAQAAGLEGALIGLVASGFNPIVGIIAGITSYLIAAKAAALAYTEALRASVYGDMTISAETFTAILNTQNSALVDGTNKLISMDEEMQRLASDYLEQTNNATLYMQTLLFANDNAQATMLSYSNNLYSNLQSMIETSKQIMQQSLDEDMLYMQTYYADELANGDAYATSRLNAIIQNNTDAKMLIEKWTKEINEINEHGYKTRGYYTDEEIKKIQELQDKIDELTGANAKALSTAETDMSYWSSKIIDEQNGWSKESYENWKTAKDTYLKEQKEAAQTSYNTEINAAQKIYNETVATAKQMYEEQMISVDEYNKRLEEAATTRTNAEETAAKNREEIIKTAENRIKEYEQNISDNLSALYTKMGEDAEVQRKEIESQWEKLGDNEKIKDGLNGYRTYITDAAKLDPDTLQAWKDAGVDLGEEFNDGINSTTLSSIKGKKVSVQYSLDMSTASNGKTATFNFIPSKVRFYDEGGLPDMGDMLVMNERGPELLATLGNHKPIIANQDQVVQTLTNAIVSGFNMIQPNNGGQPQTIIFNVADETIYKGQINHQNREIDRYGSTRIINI